MTAYRGRLRAALFDTFPGIPAPGAKPWSEVWDEYAAALLASGAVVDPAQAWDRGHRTCVCDRPGATSMCRNPYRAEHLAGGAHDG